MAPAIAALREPESSFTGAVFDGRYRVGEPLGRGAAGIVFEAMSLGPALACHGRRRVAIKLLTADPARDREAVDRFTHEAYLGSRLHHSRLVRVLDFGALRDGRPWYAMELCRGVPLDRMLRRTDVLPGDLAARLVGDAASGLEALHRAGVVHRDVKPANLFVTGNRRPRLKLLDLGVAAVFDERRARRVGVAQAGCHGRYGTPAYLAPEQVLGQNVGPAADVYALACVAYRMLTGRDAFWGRTLEATVRSHLFDSPAPASSVNPALSPAVDAALAAALEKTPSARTASPARLAAELMVALPSDA